ncbi:MAG: asparagine synthase (glutamine-hydrolyzing) [Pseudomonadota bacterium]
MCGISGIVGAEPLAPGTFRLVQHMNEAQAHRGPDGDGIWKSEQAILAQRRLAIIDLSDRGRQPMPDPEQRYVLVCNGEIYNHQTLRKQLSDEGYHFSSGTDVEVILPLYKKYGKDCCKHLVGMFAFAIWDNTERELFLCRDRIGEKPLYYAESNGKIAFSSEIKALLNLPWVDSSLCEETIPNLFFFGITPAPLTPFNGIKMLPPATWMHWRDGKSCFERYWSIDFAAVRHRSMDDALDEYEHLLLQSVQGCLVADVPVGIMLSGGVDSSTIVWASIAQGFDAQTFCVTASGHEHSGEAALSSRVAEHLGSRHKIISFDPAQHISRLPNVFRAHDRPYNNPAAWFADELAKKMREEVKVALSGNAADELFAGYAGYNKHCMHSPAQRILNLIPRNHRKALLGISPGRMKASLAASLTSNRQRLTQSVSSLVRKGMKENLTPEFFNKWQDYEAGKHFEQYLEESNPSTLLQAVRYTDLMVTHQHGHTILSDISGMSRGLEYRSPFLDHRLVEFAFSLEDSLLLPDPCNPTQNKQIMKCFLERHLPREIVYEPKRGFGYDIDFMKLFMRHGKTLQRQVGNDRMRSLNIFDPVFLETALMKSLSSAWMALAFSIWADLYLFGFSIEEISSTICPAPGDNR